MKFVPLSTPKANDFVVEFHRHNGRTAMNRGRFAIGLKVENELVGVAIVGNPISATFMDGVTAEILRVCTNDDAPKGAVSALYARCWKIWKEMGGKRIITYTLCEETGSSLRGAGFRCCGEASQVRPGWNKNDGIKREWQEVMGKKKYRWEKKCQ